MPLVYACIAPHGDELIPELVGKAKTAKESVRGMVKLSSELKAANPDTIIVATPHNLRLIGHIGVVVAENSSGRVGSRSKTISLEAKCDVKLAREILAAAAGAGLPVVGANYGTFTGELSDMAMDWGTLIPLWFFLKLNRLRKSRIVIVTPSRDTPLQQNFEFGVSVGAVAESSEKRVAFVASADQAHAHDPKGPYGFSPKARAYDAAIVNAVEKDRLSDILKLEESLVDAAKPDSLWQMAVLAGVLKRVKMHGTLYSYEVPTYFGMLCAGYSRPRRALGRS